MVNPQLYNSGPMPGLDGNFYSEKTVDFATSQADVIITNLKLDASQVGLGFLSNPVEGPSQFTPLNVISAAFSCLTTGEQCGSYKPKAKYPSLRGIMSWAIQWDEAQDYLFTNSATKILSGKQ